jgi:hypothetical protein
VNKAQQKAEARRRFQEMLDKRKASGIPETPLQRLQRIVDEKETAGRLCFETEGYTLVNSCNLYLQSAGYFEGDDGNVEEEIRFGRLLIQVLQEEIAGAAGFRVRT